jgi:hypothetical protein
MRIVVLALILAGLLSAEASAKTIHASAWKGKLIVYTNFKVQDERHKPGNDNVKLAEGDHLMSGKIRHLLLPHGGARSSRLGGSGSLEQLKGSVKSSMSDVDAIRSLRWDCNGKIRNNGGSTLQARLMQGYSGALKLVIDGFSLVPKETCSREEGWSSPTTIDGWPEDWVFPTPSSPQSRKSLSLQSDWWRFYASCGEGEEREGSGAPPGVVNVSDGDEHCISGHVVRIHTLLDLRRTCADVELRFSRSSASEKCLRR